MELLLCGIISVEGNLKAYVDDRIKEINDMIKNTDDASCHPSDVMPYFLKKYWQKLKTNFESGDIKELLHVENLFALINKSETGLLAKLYVNKENHGMLEGSMIMPRARGDLVNFFSKFGYTPIKIDTIKLDNANSLEVDIVDGDFVFK